MSNINLKTIGSLPLAEEVNENTSLVGWDGEKTVRVAKDMVGGTSDAVQYIPQELTEEQQMQARKNLALPYKMTGDVEILPKQTLNFELVPYLGYNADLPYGFSLTVGKTYVVTYDGETFEGVALDGKEVGLGENTFIGNPEFGFENWPVMIWCPENKYMATDMANEAGEHELTVVEKDSEVIVPLQPEFLPNQTILIEEIEDFGRPGYGTGEYKCSLTFEQVRDIYLKNGWMNVYLKRPLVESNGAKRSITVGMHSVIEYAADFDGEGNFQIGGFMWHGNDSESNIEIYWELGSDPQVTVN